MKLQNLSIPEENFPAVYTNVLLMMYAELRIIRLQMSHFIATKVDADPAKLDQEYGEEAEKVFDDKWVDLLAQLGK